jgi:hypothetical protein
MSESLWQFFRAEEIKRDTRNARRSLQVLTNLTAAQSALHSQQQAQTNAKLAEMKEIMLASLSPEQRLAYEQQVTLRTKQESEARQKADLLRAEEGAKYRVVRMIIFFVPFLALFVLGLVRLCF